MYFSHTVPPYLTILPSFSGSRILLYCISEARPIATVQWYRGNTPVGYPRLVTVLITVPIELLYTSGYTCVGKNTAGNKINTVSETFRIQSKGQYIQRI